MIKNYIVVALRNIKRFKIHSIINIGGMAIGIACALTLFLFVFDELGYDSYNTNADNIYRVYTQSVIKGTKSCNSKSAPPAGRTMLQYFPEVKAYTRIGYNGQYTFSYKDKQYREGGVYLADSNYFDVFTLPFLSGNPHTALQRPNSLVITEKAAAKYFGSENPIGKSIQVEGIGSFMVTGVMKNFPKKSHFSTNFLLSMSTFKDGESDSWLDNVFTTYVVLQDGTDPHQIEIKLRRLVLEQVGPQAEKYLGVPLSDFFKSGNTYEILLQPLRKIYLYSQRDYELDPNTEWGDIKQSDIAYIYIFAGGGLFIILIAIINFMNLSTARSEHRAKEVGVRKTLGAAQPQLIAQFLVEAIVMSTISVALSLLLLQITLPLFNQLADRNLSFNVVEYPYLIPLLLLFSLLIGVFAGSYPAFYLSSFKPVDILKGQIGRGGRKTRLRSTLVLVQFSISIALIICTLVVRQQLSYLQNKNLGFKKDLLVAIQNGKTLGTAMQPFMTALQKNPNILSVTNSSRMFLPGIAGRAFLYNKTVGANPISALYLMVDSKFQKTFQVQTKYGRFFSEEFTSDSSAVVINETMAKEIGTANPVGGELTCLTGKTYKIIGVVKDFNCESLHQSVRPLVFVLSPVEQAASIVTMRIAPTNIEATLAYIDKTWKQFVLSEKCFHPFVDEQLARLYESEEKTGKVASIFALLAISIACLGLFGLSSFVTEQRVKEIGIRKVLGASVLQLVLLLSKEFLKWVLFANIIAWPIAYYLMNAWLQDFAYRTDLGLPLFLLAAFFALLIALITVSAQTIKAALSNPVKCLRYE